MPTIKANPAVLRMEPGTLRMTGIRYETGWHDPLRPYLWERIVGEAWTPIDPLEDRVIPEKGKDPKEEGFFLQELHPGQTYQVRMYHDESVDPNRSDQSADAEASAVGLLKGVGPSELISLDEHGAGGTFFECHVRTVVATQAFLQVSAAPPTFDAEEFGSFKSVLGDDTDEVLATSHALEVASEALLPGNPFHALLLVVDGEGNWQMEHHAFTTKRRRVTIGFEELHVINDGAEGNNEARFTNWILQGNRIQSVCNVPEQEITDRPSPGEELLEHIPLGFHCGLPITLGPERITADNWRLAILTRGIAPVTIGSDEKAGNFLPGPPGSSPDIFGGSPFPGANFPFPVGSKREEMKDEPFEVTAIPFASDDELRYSVLALFSVEYV